MRDLPIGIFDSGVGGLTVLRALLERLPQEEYFFLGDTARLPYGTKGRDTIIEYTVHAATSLLAKSQLKMLIIACNTATSVALPILQARFPNMPVLGVIEPGAIAAVRASKNGCIAVLATEATVRAGGYVKAIERLNPKATIVSQACTLFVPLAEEGWNEGEIAEAIVRRYIGGLFTPTQKPDTLLLGCTHFPLLLPAIRAVVGPEITIVDSAQTTAEAVEQVLTQTECRRALASGKVHFMATDNTERFASTGGHFLGRALRKEDIELVNI